MSTESSKPTNMLQDVHKCFINSAVFFREEVCAECNWSIPTFYRKMRGMDKPNEHFKDRIIPALSNAEKEGILRKAYLVLEDIKVCLDKYSK